MPINPINGRYTGLLGYTRNFENFGAGLPFRIVEKYSYEVYDYELSNINGENLPPHFKSSFSEYLGAASGDLNITSLSVSNSRDSKEDGKRFQKYNLSFEVRRADLYQQGYSDGKLSGLSGCIGSGYDLLKDLSEDFSFDTSETREKSFKHSLSFSLRTGLGNFSFNSLKTMASDLAHSILDTDSEAALSKIGFIEFTGFTPDNSRLYYNETYDRFKNSFSFEKSRKILPYLSGNYSCSLGHVINYDEQGYFKIEEKIKTNGKSSYSQALSGFEEELSFSQARCAKIVTGYFPMLSLQTYGLTGSGDSRLTKTALNKTCNVPGLSVDGSVIYTNNPSFYSGFVRTSDVSVSKAQNGVIDIEHKLQYSINAHLSGRTDTMAASGLNNIVGLMSLDRGSSLNVCSSVYSSLSGITGISTGITRIKSQYSAPILGKSYSSSFSYSDSPIYNMIRTNPFNSEKITGFKQLEVSVDSSKPKDSIQEYKIVNRPTQQTVLSYAYQQEPASATVSYKGIINRHGNSFDNHYWPTGEVNGLAAESQSVFLNRVLLNSTMFNYYMAGLKYDFDSDNNLSLSVEYNYTLKK